MNNIQVVWRGIVHDSTGYARVSRENILALDAIGVDVKVEPISFGSSHAEIEPEKVARLNQLILKPLAEDKIKVLVYQAQPHGLDATKEKENYDFVVNAPFWETTKIPRNWLPNINLFDAVIAPSLANKEWYENSGVTVPIYYAPVGADIENYNTSNSKLGLAEVFDNFNFLSVFQWQHRKGPDILLKAFWQEFTKDDNVALIMKTHFGNSSKADQRAIRNAISQFKQTQGFGDETARVYLSPSIFSDEELKGLYTLSNIYVLPTRGEGAGLPYMEAMASGIPVIAPAWGGQMDFLTEENSYLVDYEITPTTLYAENALAPTFPQLFTSDMEWSEPSIESLRKQMRRAYEDHEEVREKGKKARETMETITWKDVAYTLRDALEMVVSQSENKQ
jgi:glycosyltransferase involved in cell wall biosynthesis